MKSYDDYLKDAKKTGSSEELTQDFFAFSQPGDSFQGIFLYQETVEIKEGMKPVQRYVFATPEGVKSLLLGGATDKQVSNKMERGDILYIVYKGKRELDGDRQPMNVFDVHKLTHMEEADVEAFLHGLGDIPF